MITADTRVHELINYIKNNNPNKNNKEVALDLMTAQITSGSQEYIDWIINQTKDAAKEINDDSNIMIDQKLRINNQRHNSQKHSSQW